jgi:hypothetical protein
MECVLSGAGNTSDGEIQELERHSPEQDTFV